jgi:hypothetical protein
MAGRGCMIRPGHFFMAARFPRQNSLGSLSFSLVGLVGVLAVVMASATIWLLLTDPVTVAESVDSGEVSPLVRSLAGAIYDALRGLLKYL